MVQLPTHLEALCGSEEGEGTGQSFEEGSRVEVKFGRAFGTKVDQFLP